ncbi:hypothetical protein OCU04_004843 [Sclerotinia nivalis]|uniref:Uncharacterized protein n=1 Tax=Sclerotinia nivalis TaxID=352851 RepID=A0A9X0ARD1_9HELO|nr:hypothetical protein OCU04_004843 [Sclerotinia nivalis]
MDQVPSPRYCFQTRPIQSRAHFDNAAEPYIPGIPTMKAPRSGGCETVDRFIDRFNKSRQQWERKVREGHYHHYVPPITRENIDETDNLQPPVNVDIKKVIRPSDRWIAENPVENLGSMAEDYDYIRAEDLSAAFMNDPNSVAKYVIAHRHEDPVMYLLVESPRNNSGQPLPPTNMPQPNMQPVAGSSRPSLATQNQPRNLQSRNILNDDPSVPNTSFSIPSPANSSSHSPS